MFSAVIISPDPVWRQIVHEVSADSKQVLTHRICDEYPHPYDLARLMNTITPDFVFLDVSEPDKALACAASIREIHSRTVIIGFAGGSLGSAGLDTHGIIAVLPSPLDTESFTRTVEESIHKALGGVQENLLAFLPSKAGSGCSTVVLHTACALANSFKKKVLVVEADLRSGALSIFLNSIPEGTIQSALRSTSELDVFKLDQCITKKHGIDLLLSNNAPEGPLPVWHQYFQFLEFVRARYDWILVDLPELVNPATAEIVRRARGVYTVCTQEIPSLKLAQRRFQDLAVRGVPVERRHLILNRWHKQEIAATDVEQFLHIPIQATIPNDYKAFRAALVDGNCVPERTPAGQAFIEFARALADERPPDKQRSMIPDQIAGLFRRNRPILGAHG
jgi:Flp pilus assembly CpaE family ATPase